MYVDVCMCLCIFPDSIVLLSCKIFFFLHSKLSVLLVIYAANVLFYLPFKFVQDVLTGEFFILMQSFNQSFPVTFSSDLFWQSFGITPSEKHWWSCLLVDLFLTHNSLLCPKCSIQLISFHSLEFTKAFANLGPERHVVMPAL